MSILTRSFIFDNVTTIAVFIITIVLARLFIRQGPKLPPSPWLMPFMGYLPLLISKDKRQVFKQLSVKYGNLVYLRVGSLPILLVSGRDMIHEVLVKRAREFEGRPQVFTTLKPGQGKGVVNSSGPVWREHRSFLVSKMKGLGIGKTSFEDNIFQEINPFLEVIESTNGAQFDSRFTIQTAMSNIISFIAFGKRFDYKDEQFANMLRLIESNMKLVGGTSIVNYFPFLEHLPGDPLQCQASLETVGKVQKVTRAWVEDHKSNFDPNNPRDIIDLYLLEMQRKQEMGENTKLDESQLIKFVGDLLVAGAETTATTFQWMLLFLVRHPCVQQQVYEELSAVLSSHKHLSFQDKDKMPYTVATIFESQRLADIAPFSLPHSNPEAVHIDGYTIPKGTLVLPLLNSLHHNSALWENPTEFRPDRFLDEKRQKVVNSKDIVPYSLGSRACPGQTLAFMELFFFLTSIIQRFVVLPGDEEELPPLKGHIGVTYVPQEHKLRFIPRSA